MRRFMVFIDWIQTTAKLFFLFFSLFLLVARKKKSLISFGVLLLAHSFFRLTCLAFTYDWLHSYLQRCREVQPHHLVNSYRFDIFGVLMWSRFFFPLAASIYLPFIIGKTTNTLEFLHKIQSRFTQRGRCTIQPNNWCLYIELTMGFTALSFGFYSKSLNSQNNHLLWSQWMTMILHSFDISTEITVRTLMFCSHHHHHFQIKFNLNWSKSWTRTINHQTMWNFK